MTVYIVLDAWGSDVPEVRKVFATEALADAYITDSLKNADDYEQSRHVYYIKPMEVIGA